MLTILVVDDDPEESAIIEVFLKSLGHDSVAFNEPVKALHSLQKQEIQPEILIVDLNMPEINGLDFIRKMREFGWDLPTILTCTDPDRDLLNEVLDMGLGEILHKPIQKSELEQELQEIIEEYDV